MSYFFSKHHIKLMKERDIYDLFLSRYAIEQMKTIIFVNLPDEGEEIVKDKAFGDIESIKTVADLISPVNAKVLEINQDVVDDPTVLMEDPENCWLMKIETADSLDDMMTEAEYMEYVKTL